jgi:hypothetical protein
MTSAWILLDPKMTPEMLGFLPGMLDTNDPRPAREQLDAGYAFAGGWNPMPGWLMDPVTMAIAYPGDEPLYPLALTGIGKEVVVFYPHSWVMVRWGEAEFEVARMD